ncbi:MAG: amino acid permease [Rhodospirillales bacterium 20-64-7]|nr:MAG: amino acid permease [Rhodospirillales bacterium 20-64-7]HQT76756.1 amino acid permease [Rhodopila sp.]
MSMTQYTARKSLDAIAKSADGHGSGLTRTLGPFSLIGLGIGCIIGAGIFVLTGKAAASYAGPAISLSFILSGVACAFVGLCYAELAAMIPASGSAYTYAYATVGEIFAWIIGWDLILEYAMGASTVAVGWSGYFTSLLDGFGVHLPAAWVNATGTVVKLADGASVTAIFNLPAALIVAGLTALLMLGTRESTRVNNIMVAFKLFVVVAVIVVGAMFLNTHNWVPFIPANTGSFGNFGWSGILRGASVVFFAYIGFDAVSTAAQEAKRPQRDMPIGILGSLVICTILYILMALAMTGLVPYQKLGVADPVAVAIDATGIGWLSVLVKFAALAGLTTVIFVLLFGQARILFSMATDRLLPPLFSQVHPRFRTPLLSQGVIGVIVALIAGCFPIGLLGEMVSIGTLFAFLLVCLAVIHLRRHEPSTKRPFRTPGVPVVPLLGMAFSLLLMIGLPLATWLRLVVWLAIGLVIYFGYGHRHSVVPAPGE